MEIGVQYQYGCLRLKLNYSQTMQSLIMQIGKKINVSPKFLSLYFDHDFDNRVPDRNTVMNSGMKNKMIVYLKSSVEIPKQTICQLTQSTDNYKDYLAPTETEMTPEMKRIRKDFSKYTISTHFIEHRNALKPHIGDQTESSCYKFRIGYECIKRFQSYALQNQFSKHRIGILFGRINEITGAVTAHVLMEPLQENYEDHVIIKNESLKNYHLNPDIEKSRKIAKLFGMTIVGMAISHKQNPKFPMTSYMIRLASRMQNLFGEYFTTLVVTPSASESVSIEAFQVTDAAMQIERENLYDDSNTDPKIVKFKEPIDTCNVNRTEADVNLLLCAVRIKNTKSRFLGHTFPPPSHTPSLIDLKMYFREISYAPTWVQLFDFNLLLFLFQKRILQEIEIKEVVNDIIGMKDVHESIMSKIYNSFEDISKD